MEGAPGQQVPAGQGAEGQQTRHQPCKELHPWEDGEGKKGISCPELHMTQCQRRRTSKVEFRGCLVLRDSSPF